MHSTKSRKVPDRRKSRELDFSFSLDESSLRCVFHQITTLTLVNYDKDESSSASTEYTRNVYARIVNFKNLKHLNIVPTGMMAYPGLSLRNLPPSTFHSSVLTDLHIHVETFVDCLHLLDGRLKQLTTLSVVLYSIGDFSTTDVHNQVKVFTNLVTYQIGIAAPWKHRM